MTFVLWVRDLLILALVLGVGILLMAGIGLMLIRGSKDDPS